MRDELRNRAVVIDSENVLAREVSGILRTRKDYYTTIDNEYGYSILKKELPKDRVTVLVNGGGGLGQLFPGIVADDLADGICMGEMDAAPNAYAIYDLAKELDCGQGVIILTNNYAGDVLNNDMAIELLENDGITGKLCAVADSLFSSEIRSERSGLSGILMLTKIASLAAQQGKALVEIQAILETVNANISSAIALIDHNERVVFGKGLSGEPPVFEKQWESEADFIQHICEFILNDLPRFYTKKLWIQINSMLKLSYLEGNVLLDGICHYFESKGYAIDFASVGRFYDMFNETGIILSVVPMTEQLLAYAKPVHGYDFTV